MGSFQSLSFCLLAMEVVSYSAALGVIGIGRDRGGKEKFLSVRFHPGESKQQLQKQL